MHKTLPFSAEDWVPDARVPCEEGVHTLWSKLLPSAYSTYGPNRWRQQVLLVKIMVVALGADAGRGAAEDG